MFPRRALQSIGWRQTEAVRDSLTTGAVAAARGLPCRAVKTKTVLVAAVAALICLFAAPSASAADPARWVETGRSQIPLQYYQGVTSDPARNFFFSGHVGLYRTDPELRETGRNDDAIPPTVHLAEGYNHIAT